ncbi:TetR/AcrR family transcriptional regulator [Nonomuraea sp. NPDC059194]|uniref:TetR/AcrR family transcriptional regulator n=1 Tax=Nonomuraea sp. NPDC059194 TaxID=3346764 RepID=UPI0036C476D1
MPPAFSEEERSRITEQLIDTATRLFSAQGLRKTSLEELTAPAGIAKSSLYAFFDSKEDLYLEAMLRQNEQVRRRVIDEGLNRGTDTRDALRRFLRATVAELDGNPLYRRLMSHPQEMAAVAAKLTPERMAAAERGPMADLTRFLSTRVLGTHVLGTHGEGDPEVLLGVLRAVLLTPLHAEHLGAVYPAVMDRLIDAVTEGITSC